jgi:ubiquinone/menaquinone biosynthesis C-methylase UbiE
MINNTDQENLFPKKISKLTAEQKLIKDDFMEHWLKVLRKNYTILDRFNHKVVVNNKPKNFLKTLEIGAGLGEHLNYEKLNDNQKKNYYAMDIRENLLKIISKEHPKINTILGDCEEKINFENNFFDRVLAIHILEHLPNLPNAINEVARVLKNSGMFQIVIPCEGSIAYTIARKISAKRIFEKKYKTSYDWYIKSEHVNLPHEIISELKKKFVIIKKTYFPIPISIEFCNLCIALNLKIKVKLGGTF